MNDNRMKLMVGILLFLAWIASIVGKHFWPDLGTGELNVVLVGMIAGLSGYHAGSSNGVSDEKVINVGAGK